MAVRPPGATPWLMSRSRSYHHGSLPTALVAAALEVIDERGLDGLSMREVARRAGVSSGAPFRHFADKNALLATIAEQGMARFIAAIEAARAHAPDDPLERFQDAGVAFVRFAVDHPAYFRVMFWAGLSTLESQPLGELRQRSRALFRELVLDAQATGRLRPGPPEPIMITAYAICYGLARFYVDGLCDVVGVPPDQDPDAIARMVTTQLRHGLEP